MNTNITLSLDTRRVRKDGAFPLVFRLGHNARTTAIQTGINLKEKDWNEKDRKIRATYEGAATQLNNMLQKQRAEAMDIILKLHEAGQLQGMTVTELREKITQPRKTTSFYAFADDLIAELKAAGRIGTASSYQDAANALRNHAGGSDLSFAQITFSFLTRFETAHIARGNGYNGLSVYLRAIRAIYNKAVKAGLVEKERSPFADYKIRTAPTEKRALDAEDLGRIVAADLPTGGRLFDVRNVFLASYMMYGMNFTDMAFLKKADIVDGRIQYRRRKTAKLYDIKVTPQLAEILAHYTAQNPDSPYVFPVLKRAGAELQSRDIKWARKRYNKGLKELAALCGITRKLTSYVSRHSFATQAMMQDVPLAAISAMLGHSSLKTTEIYLKSLPTETLDGYNARIVLGGK